MFITVKVSAVGSDETTFTVPFIPSRAETAPRRMFENRQCVRSFRDAVASAMAKELELKSDIMSVEDLGDLGVKHLIGFYRRKKNGCWTLVGGVEIICPV